MGLGTPPIHTGAETMVLTPRVPRGLQVAWLESRGGVPAVLICLQVTLGTWNSHRSLKEDLVVLPPKMYMVSSPAHAQCPLRCAGDLVALCCGTQHIVDRSNQCRSLKQRPGALPGRCKAVEWAAQEAAGSSIRRSGRAPSGPASPL